MNIVTYRSRRRAEGMLRGLGALTVDEANSALFEAQGKLNKFTTISDKLDFVNAPLTISDIPQFMRDACVIDINGVRLEMVQLASMKIDRDDLRNMVNDTGLWFNRRVAAWFYLRVLIRGGASGWPFQNITNAIVTPLAEQTPGYAAYLAAVAFGPAAAVAAGIAAKFGGKKAKVGYHFYKATETENGSNTDEALSEWAVFPLGWVMEQYPKRGAEGWAGIHGKQLKWFVRWFNSVCPKLKQNIIDATRDVGLAQANVESAKAVEEAAQVKADADKRITSSENVLKDESGGWSTSRILLIGGIALAGLATVLVLTKKKS
jgi:hypothetical protein